MPTAFTLLRGAKVTGKEVSVSGEVCKRRARLPSGKWRTWETQLIESPEAEEARKHLVLGKRMAIKITGGVHG